MSFSYICRMFCSLESIRIKWIFLNIKSCIIAICLTLNTEMGVDHLVDERKEQSLEKQLVLQNDVKRKR
jgi:hypothetical protein